MLLVPSGHVYSTSPTAGIESYWRLVRRPGYEDPLVALCILGVEAVQDVAGLLVIEERKQEGIIVLVPALFWLPVGPQHQLLWKPDHYSSHTINTESIHFIFCIFIKIKSFFHNLIKLETLVITGSSQFCTKGQSLNPECWDDHQED